MELLIKEIDNLRIEKDKIRARIEQLEKYNLSYQYLTDNPQKLKFYTGLHVDVFENIFTFLHTFLQSNSRCKISPEDQFILVLIKLRLTFHLKIWLINFILLKAL